MNLKRVIGGPLLSLFFLMFFACIILGMQSTFENFPLQHNNAAFSASLSDAVQNQVLIQPVVVNNPLPEINAKSAISLESDLNDINKIIFEKDINVQLPIASLTKLMTAVVVLDNYKLSDTIVVDKIADSQDPMKQDVKLGDKMTVESFLEIMLVGSSNKSAYALSEGPEGYPGQQKFVNLMNEKAKYLGLNKTFFTDPTGLSQEDTSTASDLARFAKYILKNYPQIAEISKMKELYIPGIGYITNTDELLNEIPDAVCSKTGFTISAKGCLLLAVKNPQNNNYLINIILGADDRFAEMRKLIQVCD